MVKLPLSAQVGSCESYGWTCIALLLGKALGLLGDMPTLQCSPESEYRSTDRGSEARRKEEAKEDRCPSDVEGVIGRLLNTEGTSEQYPELHCLRKGLDTDRKEAKQANLSFPPAEKTALSARLQQEKRVNLLG